ncbi:M48 family metalloprotease [Aquimonas sp.]|jgi:predicted Zn-dependent protease|uniref:M48 family metalloprotease n=1 Tax=Aquimonas sp. TaxID=1872588 RepID=UPI0037C0F53A
MSIRPSALLILLSAATFSTGLLAQARDPLQLPDMGSSAGTLITPGEEKQYGEYTLFQLRAYQMLLEDPLLDEYLNRLGNRLASFSDRPQQEFTFFWMHSRDINAFATLGGYVGMNAGLVLTAQTEDEVAAVLAHEISHVTQRHIVRAVERQQKDTLPILLATLGAVVLAQQAGGSSAGNATQAAITSGMALLQQRSINHTRSNEYEADRVGIATLAKAGYQPMAMADFFGRMHRTLRSTIGAEEAPEFLRTHPVTSSRISEAKGRAEGATRPIGFVPPIKPTAEPINPLLPGGMYAHVGLDAPPSRELFPWVQARLRVLSAGSPGQAVDELNRRAVALGASLPEPERYGFALALSRTGEAERALAELAKIRQPPPGFWIELAEAELLHLAGRQAESESAYAQLLALYPDSRPIVLGYADVLIRTGGSEHGRRAQEVLRPLLLRRGDDIALQRSFGRASELAGDIVRASEAHAEASYLSGRAEDALNQLQALKLRDDLDYYQRARIDARIAELTPVVLELRERGIRAGREQQSNRGLEQTTAFRVTQGS